MKKAPDKGTKKNLNGFPWRKNHKLLSNSLKLSMLRKKLKRGLFPDRGESRDDLR